MNNITNLVLKNRKELFENKKKIISQENNIKKINLMYIKNNNQSKILKNNNIKIILKEKIKNIDPWYKKICTLKTLPENIRQLAMHTTYKSTAEYWNIYLLDKKKYLIQNDEWVFLKKELRTITTKKIQLVITKNKLNTPTPHEWFYKIYKERILEEYLLLTKDPNLKILKKFFSIELHKKNINLI